MNYTIIEMPTINLTATKAKIDLKIQAYNEGLSLSQQIRGYHFDTLWRIVEHFAYKIMNDNKTLSPSLRRIRLDHPERILWTTKLSRENIREWIRVNSIETVSRRLNRLAKAGLIDLKKRSKDKQHLTSRISLNKDIIAIEDILDSSRNNHAQKSVKTRSNELKNDFKIAKNRFIENQQVSPKNTTSCRPLLNITTKCNLNNKLMVKGAFSEKSEKELSTFQNSANSGNPLPSTPNQENVLEDTKTNSRKYAEKIHGKPKRDRYEVFAAQSDAEKLEDYRRSMAEHVFRESLILWKHRSDVYVGEYKKAALYVAENFFKDDFYHSKERINEGVLRALWCINFQKGQQKTAKMQENKDQFVFYPYKYFTAKGTGSFDGLRKYYSRYKQGHTLSPYERSLKKIKPTKVQKNFSKEILAIRQYVAHYLEGKRNLQSLKRFESLIKKKYPNKPKYLDQFRKMISGHFVH